MLIMSRCVCVYGRVGKTMVLMGILREMRNTTNDKIVIVSNYTQTLDMLSKMCDAQRYQWLRLDGTTPLSQRQKLVDKFNDPTNKACTFPWTCERAAWWDERRLVTDYCWGMCAGEW